MTTMLEDCTTEEQRSVVLFFLWAEGLIAEDIHKEIFHVYKEKCLLIKAVHNWSRNSIKDFRKSQTTNRRCGSG
jgi:hypothetical protein